MARAARVAAACVLVAAGAGYLSDLGYNAAQPSNPAVNQSLADWLVAHKLTSGIGGYWDANVTSLDSGGAVRVAPVADGASYGYLWVAKPAWFDPKVSSANFVIAHVQQLGAGYVYVARPSTGTASPRRNTTSARPWSWSTTATCCKASYNRCSATSRAAGRVRPSRPDCFIRCVSS